jgi:chemotaxis response regulator CheB
MSATHRIMLVEDETIIAMDVQQRLEKLGYEVVAQAASGADAIRRAMEIAPDLILMDVKIRGPLDGIETATRIREQQDIPVITPSGERVRRKPSGTCSSHSKIASSGLLSRLPFTSTRWRKNCDSARSATPSPCRLPMTGSGTGI